ncbi:MAG TPA: IMP dehydrogenase [Chloroflexia bacterium]|nr:IMP dehydrogenase [Chloroflexia bacterium]
MEYEELSPSTLNRMNTLEFNSRFHAKSRLQNLRVGYSYDDITLRPGPTESLSRDQISTRSRLCADLWMEVPVLGANMNMVGTRMMVEMAKAGGAAVAHRNNAIEQEVETVKAVKAVQVDEAFRTQNPLATLDKAGERLLALASIGLTGDYLERAEALLLADVDVLVADTPHAHNNKLTPQALINLRGLMKRLNRFVPVIVGNVSDDRGARFLGLMAEEGLCHAVKVGQGPGSFCETRVVAGFGVPQATAIDDAVTALESMGLTDLPVIADGGIKNSGDMAKALGLKASSVMIGGLLTPLAESTAQVVEKDGKSYVLGQGNASQGVQKSVGKQRAAEGIEVLVPLEQQRRSVREQMQLWHEGIQSGMGSVGAENIADFYDKAEFLLLTAAAYQEGVPHAAFRAGSIVISQ